jgi:FkbM family methyltransferase
MSIIKSNLKKILTLFLNVNFYILLKLILLSVFKKRGIIRFKGLKIKYTDGKSLVGMFHEIFYLEHYKFRSKIENPIIIDCGANIGLSVLYFHSILKNAKIIAYEADPIIANVLKENLSSNNCDAEIVQKAIWINNNEKLSFSSSGADAGTLFSNENTIIVDSVRLKNILESYNRIELLKIDIEGAEIEVIKDCQDSLSHIDKIFVEYHSFSTSKQELDILLSIMSKQGFRYKILPARKEKTPFLVNTKHEQMDLQLNIFFFRL